MRLSVFRCVSLVLVIAGFVFSFGCGHSSSSSSSTTTVGVAPQFTSVPPTVVQEGVLYTYDVTTTTTDSSTVTYKLTTGPSDASMSGNVLSWTPSHAEGRVANSFVITATTSNNGTNTQSFSLTPTGTINATAVDHFVTGKGLVDAPENLSKDTVEILFPDGKGGYTAIPGSGDTGGNATVANVAAGSFWLHIATPPGTLPISAVRNDYIWTSASDLDVGMLRGGRDYVTQLTSPVTINPNVTLKVTPAGTDAIDWSSPDAGLFGTTPIFGPSNPFTTSFSQSGPQIEASQGDRAFLLHYSSFGGVAPHPQLLKEFLEDTSVNETSGGSVSVSGTMTTTSGVSVDPNIDFTQFDLLVQSNATGTTAKVFQVVDPMYDASEGLALGIPLVAEVFSSSTTGVVNSGTVTTGLVASGDMPIATLEVLRQASYTSSSGPLLIGVGPVVSTSTLPSSSSAMTPVVSQPLSATVDGKDFFTASTVSTAPQLSWSSPTTGTVSYYVVSVLDLTAPTTPLSSWVFFTPNHSVTIPGGLLSSGDSFAVTISAVVASSNTFATAPFRHGTDIAATSIASATMTASSSSGTVKRSAVAAPAAKHTIVVTPAADGQLKMQAK